MTIGERIKERRIQLGFSVDELAQKIGKNRATIYRYESNDIENFPITILEPLAKVLETTPSYLMGWEEKPNPTFSFYLDMQLGLLGYSIEYDEEGNVTLFDKDEAYEITDNDVRELRNSVSSYIQFKLQEIKVRSKKCTASSVQKFRASSQVLNAAQKRTDIEIPEGVDTSENDIMKDDNF